MARLVYFLEKIYIRKDWPKGTPSLSVTLKESGKSRADLWAFAGMYDQYTRLQSNASYKISGMIDFCGMEDSTFHIYTKFYEDCFHKYF